MSRPTPEQQLEEALRRQAEKQREREEEERRRAVKEAAREIGVSEEEFDAAEQAAIQRAAAAEAAERVKKQEEAAKSAQRARALKLGGAAAIAASVVLVGAVGLAWSMSPSAPIQEDFSGLTSRWALETNAETQASLTSVTETGRGEAAQIEVTHFGPAADGKYHVNLDLTSVQALEGLGQLSLFAKGDGLQTARVYLESGGERWRSPPMTLGADWQQYQWSIRDFEHQVRGSDGWKVVDFRYPESGRISIKVGHFMNPVDATGRVWVDDLVVE